ncbi:ABC transporter permease [Methylobacterium iners]|uniref:Glycine betaine uptake system permease protein YehY n=1 Tax=Methylobacterium iners TaxID=418707 RepID=A0ABQ4RVZ2_9HYPH|nr:ABC transporter permease subunit [Methylobacterium iners]GJD95000.1 Glycine betaine uptake system permease protein YehY [Methylobacterium iners]
MNGRTPQAAAIGASLSGATLLVGVLYGLPVLRIAANRLVVGLPFAAADLPGWTIDAAAGLGAGGLLILGAVRGRAGAGLAVALLATALALLVQALGAGAAELIAGRPPAVRASLGSGAWLAVGVLGTSLALAIRASRLPWLGPAVLGASAVLGTLAWQAGSLAALSLAVEYEARREVVGAALGRHLLLSLGAVLLAGLVAALLAAPRRGRGVVDLAVSGIQVVPAIALFGGLVALISGLLNAAPTLRDWGFSALGPAPALLGTAAYLLLPLRRGLTAALDAPDPAVLDAATAMGLTPREILMRIRLPLGAPILIGALRVALVQSFGLATLGALVGAGGLGQVVFDGMAQFAPDLILLGAIPIVLLSFAADQALGVAEAGARRRWPA